MDKLILVLYIITTLLWAAAGVFNYYTNHIQEALLDLVLVILGVTGTYLQIKSVNKL
jgi:hypothetical protein